MRDVFNHPSLPQLIIALESVFISPGVKKETVEIVNRRQNFQSATFPSEIVTCSIGEKEPIKVFCKYGGNHPRNLYDQDILLRQGGVPYEANVYSTILVKDGLNPFGYYGNVYDKNLNFAWLFLEYLEGSIQASESSCHEDAVIQASRWIGHFHRHCANRLNIPEVSFLKKYTPEYYVRWSRQAAAFSRQLYSTFPWFVRACEESEKLIPLLTKQSQTIIHGDYYSDNILYRDGNIYPLDWGWASIAAGEQDLASITERWPQVTVEKCLQEYKNARWLGAPPPDFDQTYDTARLFLLFRWLGDRPERTLKEQNRWRFDEVKKIAQRLGLL